MTSTREPSTAKTSHNQPHHALRYPHCISAPSCRNLHRTNQTEAVDFLSETEGVSANNEDCDLADGRRVPGDDDGNQSSDVISGGASQADSDDDDDDGQNRESSRSE